MVISLADKENKLFHCSSSISNFKKKLAARTGLQEYRFFRDRKKKVTFFGLYHFIDYLKFIFHKGEKTVFWCGGDILNLQKTNYWKGIIKLIKARHICENKVEQIALRKMGIEAEILPMIFSPFLPQVSFRPRFLTGNKTHVYLCVHPKREKEYGLEIINSINYLLPNIVFHIYGVEGKNDENIVYHGKVPNWQFDEEIRNYHASLRLNEFDGFAEVTAKSILMGQYPITKIKYPTIQSFNDAVDLINILRKLETIKVPNWENRTFWWEQLQNNLESVLK